MSQTEQSRLVLDMIEVITKYLEQSKQHSLLALAEKTGLSYSSLCELTDGQPATLSPDAVLSLIEITLAPEERVAFLKKHFPKVGQIIEDIYNSQDNLTDKRAEQTFLRKRLHSFIFNLAATANGTQLNDIKRLKGEHGLAALDEMLSQEVLVRDSCDRIRYRSDGWSTTNADLILEQIRFSTEFFDKTLLGTDAARMAHVTASVHAGALKKVHALCTKFFYDLLEIQNDESNQGDIPIFVDMLMNVYDPSKLPQS